MTLQRGALGGGEGFIGFLGFIGFIGFIGFLGFRVGHCTCLGVTGLSGPNPKPPNSSV